MIAFRLSEQPLDGDALRAEVEDPTCGGFVSFEGWVRNHHHGRRVTRLEYEAYATLALAEGARVMEEARLRFGLRQALCVHRVGELALGEIAVWIGVSTPHRDAAFRACRHIIDEIKHRLPVWKKEHYDDGDSGWVNCEHQAVRAAVTPDYSRQVLLPEVGAAGQARLAAASVLVVGAGGLGVPVLQYLAGSGVGRLGIVDGDALEASNLHRQPLYSLADCGQPKAALAAARLTALNPAIRVETHAVRLTADNVVSLLADHDVIVDCTDNYTTKFLLNDWARQLRKTLVTASVYQYEGQLQVVRPQGACLRCVWPNARDGLVGNCAAAGVLGPVPALLGSLQAMEVLKVLLGLPGALGDEVVTFDLLTLETRRLKTQRAADCAQRHLPTAAAAESASAPLELEFESLGVARSAGFTLIDVRDDREREQEPAPGALHLPLAQLLSGAPLPSAEAYLLVCAHGIRSQGAASWLRERGIDRSWSLRGGLSALASHHSHAEHA